MTTRRRWAPDREWSQAYHRFALDRRRVTVPGSVAEAGARHHYWCYACLRRWRTTLSLGEQRPACPFCRQHGFIREGGPDGEV